MRAYHHAFSGAYMVRDGSGHLGEVAQGGYVKLSSIEVGVHRGRTWN